jgi:hypothetical protein
MPIDLIGSLNGVRGKPAPRPEIDLNPEVGQFARLQTFVIREGRPGGIQRAGVSGEFLGLPYEIAVAEVRKMEAFGEVLERPFLQELIPTGSVRLVRTGLRFGSHLGTGTTGHGTDLSHDLRTNVPVLGLIRGLLGQDRVLAARKLLSLASYPDDPQAQEQIARLRSVLAPPVVKRTSYVDRERSREYLWLSRYGAGYRGEWVAIDGDNLIAHAASVRELREAIRGVGGRPLIHRVE